MGLGKTIETLALMISNPPPRDAQHKATLIVCNPGLLRQCRFWTDIRFNEDLSYSK